jgi:OOP family OmpA-OmpF porin
VSISQSVIRYTFFVDDYIIIWKGFIMTGLPRLQKAIIVALVISGLAIVAKPSEAQLRPGTGVAPDTGFYLGGAVGQSKARDACDPRGLGFSGGCDDKDTNWKIFGGYNFNRNFALEFGYVDFGEVTATGTVGALPVNASVEAQAIELVAIGSIPITPQFAAYIKGGVFQWDADSRVSAGPFAGATGDDGTDWTIGAGLKWDFTRSVGARLEYQRYNNVGNVGSTGNSDIDQWTIGLMFRF